jgi:hypothetical protein
VDLGYSIIFPKHCTTCPRNHAGSTHRSLNKGFHLKAYFPVNYVMAKMQHPIGFFRLSFYSAEALMDVVK